MKKSKEIKRLRNELQKLIKLASAFELSASFDKINKNKTPTVPVDRGRLALLIESLNHARDVLKKSFERWPEKPKPDLKNQIAAEATDHE